MSRETRELQVLTKRDLEERIGEVVSELFAAEQAMVDESQDWAPVPIDPADFVKRMLPYMVYN